MKPITATVLLQRTTTLLFSYLNRMKEKFIPGIYNYCDRWCERCDFTSRCRNYEGNSKLSPEQLDMNNKAFWDNIASNFKDALKLMTKAAKKHGIDLSQPLSPEEEKQYQAKETAIRRFTRDHELAQLCKQYQQLVLPFTKTNDELVQKTRELVDHLHLGLHSEEEVVKTVAGIGDCFDIIQWYLFFIDVKLQRALHGKIENEDWETANGFQKDSDGSAKIALLAMERSIGAWVRLYELMSSSEDTALKALAILSRLKEKTLTNFPEAMQFKRPGFDD